MTLNECKTYDQVLSKIREMKDIKDKNLNLKKENIRLVSEIREMKDVKDENLNLKKENIQLVSKVEQLEFQLKQMQQSEKIKEMQRKLDKEIIHLPVEDDKDHTKIKMSADLSSAQAQLEIFKKALQEVYKKCTCQKVLQDVGQLELHESSNRINIQNQLTNLTMQLSLLYNKFSAKCNENIKIINYLVQARSIIYDLRLKTESQEYQINSLNEELSACRIVSSLQMENIYAELDRQFPAN